MNIDVMVGQLRLYGFVAVEHALPATLLAGLDHACYHSAEHPFLPSSTGRSKVQPPKGSIRGDVIRWLDDARELDHAYLDLMERLRVSLNEQLYLGLLDYQGHYAVYAAGAHYEKHLDSFAGQKNRLLSTVVYLNDSWALADGGELVLYPAGDGNALVRILPRPGLMVLFLSEEFPHEVLPASKERHSIAGWFSGRR